VIDKSIQSTTELLSFSLELFPPKTDKGTANLLRQLPLVEKINVRTITVTSGAGGSGNNRTFSTVKSIRSKTTAPPTPHVTCIGNDKNETQHILDLYAEERIYDILALRGDTNEVEVASPAHDSYGTAASLVRGVRERSDGDQFHISVAGYPEVHPKAQSRKADLDNLKRKVDEGADLILTQFFFDPKTYLDFLVDTEALGIDAPIVPGIILLTDFPRISSFAEKCGATIPDWITGRFANIEPNSKDAVSLAKEITIRQCSELVENGVRMFHLYTMNRLDSIASICETLQNEFAPKGCMGS